MTERQLIVLGRHGGKSSYGFNTDLDTLRQKPTLSQPLTSTPAIGLGGTLLPRKKRPIFTSFPPIDGAVQACHARKCSDGNRLSSSRRPAPERCSDAMAFPTPSRRECDADDKARPGREQLFPDVWLPSLKPQAGCQGKEPPHSRRRWPLPYRNRLSPAPSLRKADHLPPMGAFLPARDPTSL